jgi:hypothetical protein
MTNILIHRPRIRRVLTVLKDWLPPLTWPNRRQQTNVSQVSFNLPARKPGSGLELGARIQSIRVSNQLIKKRGQRGQKERSGKRRIAPFSRTHDFNDLELTLVLHHGRDSTMLLWTAPEVGITPSAQLSQLLHLLMLVQDIVLDGQAVWYQDYLEKQAWHTSKS